MLSDAIALLLNIEHYREPKSRGVSNLQFPKDHSCDNSPLFTVTYLDVLSSNTSDKKILQPEYQWFADWIARHEIEPGLISQYPVDLGGSENYTAHDELHAVIGNLWFAKRVYKYAKEHAWCWNTNNPVEPLPAWTNWKRYIFWKRKGFQWNLFFARHPGFTTFIKFAAKKWLMPWDYLWFIIPYIGDCFVGPQETNGRCMLLLRTRVVPKYHVFLRFFIWVWKKRMNAIYGGNGAKGFRSVYFGPEHPIAKYTKE